MVFVVSKESSVSWPSTTKSFFALQANGRRKELTFMTLVPKSSGENDCFVNGHGVAQLSIHGTNLLDAATSQSTGLLQSQDNQTGEYVIIPTT